jgi:hypothetical protein
MGGARSHRLERCDTPDLACSHFPRRPFVRALSGGKNVHQ